MGGIPLYKSYGYVLSQRVWILGFFGLKTGIDFVHFGLDSGMVFEGATGVYERICRFNSKMNKIFELEMHLKEFLVCALI